MTRDAMTPDVTALKAMPPTDFIRTVSAALRRYDLQTPSFNFAANAKLLTTFEKRAMFFYPEEAQGLIGAGMKACREYDATMEISQETREKFIIEDTKDHLRNLDMDQSTLAYKSLCETVMATVTGRMTGIGSFALSPAAVPYKVKSVTFS